MRKQIIAMLIVVFFASSVMAAVPAGYEWWKTSNGLYMCFTDGNQNDPWLGTWVRMQNHVDELVANGVKSYDMFAVYNGDRSIYYGLGPIDYYLPQTEAGTETEFDSMVAYAHSKGMAVCSWIELGYSSQNHGYWIQAQNDKAAQLDTPESRSFWWSSSPGSGEWAYSEIAGAYYKQIWGEPGFDWASADWQAEAANIVAHWMNKGLDGMVFDAYNLGDNDWGLLNATNATCKPNVQDLWNAAGGFIVPEGILDGTDSGTAVGPDSDYGFSAVNNVTGGKEKGSWNNDYYDAGSLFVEDGISPENQFANTVDVARANGGTNYGYDVVRMSDKIRPCAFAIMTTAGVIEELYFSTDYDATCTAAFYDILTVVNSHDALQPMASRLGCPSSGDYASYAHLKTSTDELSKALCIFNGHERNSNTITVDLSGAGLSLPQATTNLMTGQPGPDITSTNFTVTVEEHGNYGGFLLLDLAASVPDTDPPTPDPMTWASVPAEDTDSISMTATTASDPSGVSYYFDETTANPGGNPSGWQPGASYTDDGLVASTQYCYRVMARDNSANLNETGWSTPDKCATTPAGCTPTDMHIESVVCAEVSCGGPNKNGQATVTIYDDCGDPVTDALVDGTFSGAFNETFYDVATDGNGVAVFTTAGCIKKPSFSFTVDDVTDTLPHDPGDDLATGCSG